MTLLYSFALYFIIYWFIGWIVDTIFHTIHSWKLKKWWTFFYWPFSTIYALPCAILGLILDNLSINPYILIFTCAILLTLWEYLVAVAMESFYQKKFWDYSKRKCNYKGRICLEMSIVWALLVAFFVLFLHWFVLSLIAEVPIDLIKSLLIFFYILFFIDSALSFKKNLNEKK